MGDGLDFAAADLDVLVKTRKILVATSVLAERNLLSKMSSGKATVDVVGAEQGITTVPILRDQDVELQSPAKGDKKHAESGRSMEELSGTSQERATKERSSLRSFGIAATTVLAMSLNSGSASALNIALPTMGEDLNINDDELQWFISAYS